LSWKEYSKKSILAYLLSKGVDLAYNGKQYVCSSPFARDTNWSFIVYPNNSFYCWSTGTWGKILDLIKFYENCTLPEAIAIYKTLDLIPDHDEDRDYPKDGRMVEKKQFHYKHYINTEKSEVEAIYRYAANRGITDGFLPGFFNSCSYSADGVPVFTRRPSLMFLHVDLKNNICGAKFRNIDPDDPRRFSARGDLGFYILDTAQTKAFQDRRRVYLVESETSANSLWKYTRERRFSTIISMGGVSNPPRELPIHIRDNEIHLIIDYDGNEDLYQQRIKKYEHLKCKPIKMILPKGEDINSLYVKDKMYLIENLLLN
jgi:hypothetical protein